MENREKSKIFSNSYFSLKIFHSELRRNHYIYIRIHKNTSSTEDHSFWQAEYETVGLRDAKRSQFDTCLEGQSSVVLFL